MTYIPYLGPFFFSRYPSVALARNISDYICLILVNNLTWTQTNYNYMYIT